MKEKRGSGEADAQDERSTHSLATTEPSSPCAVSPPSLTPSSTPTQHHLTLERGGGGERQAFNKMPKWMQVRDMLLRAAQDGDRYCEQYGDIIANQVAVERFISSSKGNVERAFKDLKAHLKWRHEYRVDGIVDEDFSDLKARNEVYWGGVDKRGVPTLTWILRKHDANNQRPERFVRFFIHQIETGMRASPNYPNTTFNIMVDLDEVGLHNNDTEMVAHLQPLLVNNYPKVRKALLVFPINWLVSLLWDTLLKPILMTLQPDIEDKIIPLRGDYKAALLDRFAPEELEEAFGGTLPLSVTRPPQPLPYKRVPCSVIVQDRLRRSGSGGDTWKAQKVQGWGTKHRSSGLRVEG